MAWVLIRIGFNRMEDPAPEHLWFDAIGSIAIIAALTVVFIVGVLKARCRGRCKVLTPTTLPHW